MSRRAHYGVVALLLFVAVGRALFAAVPEPIGTVRLSGGWATFGQAVPQGLAFDGLKVGIHTTQTDVKNHWPDGSIKFAVLTVKVPFEQDYAITAAPMEVGDFAPIPRDISVDMSIAGVPHVAVAPTSGGDFWLRGPLVRETRHVVTPSAGGTPHPFLRINFDVRTYSDGGGRVDLSFENVLNQVGATTVTYDATIFINGNPSFARSGIEHFYLTRWRHTQSFGGMSFIVRPDIDALHQTRAVPKYLSLVTDEVNLPFGPTFDILKQGALNFNMPAHGGRAELAPFPDWTARYLVHRSHDQKPFVLEHGDLSGSWPVHVREPENAPAHVNGVGPSERLVSLDQRPRVWLDMRASGLDPWDNVDFIKGTPLPIKEYGAFDETTGLPIHEPGQTILIPDNAHQPSLAYVPYLLTGDRYYAEEMAFWANYAMLRTSPLDNVRQQFGILENQETRGYAWALRNIVDAAAYYPDASPVRAYLAEKVHNNLQWLDNYTNSLDPVTNPLKIPWVGWRDEPGFIALWEQNYLAYAIDRANKQGFTGGLAHRDSIAKLQLRLFSSSPTYPLTTILAEETFFGFIGASRPAGFGLPWGAPYLVAVADVIDPDRWWEPTHHTVFTTLTQVAAATQSDVHNHRPYAGFYGPEARLNLMIGVEQDWAGAQSAYAYLFPLIGVDPYVNDVPDLAHRAGWALDFYPSAPGGGEADGDGDGVPDAADNCPAVANPGQANHDGDAQGDACDLDDDNDGVSDFDEIAAGSDPFNPASTPEICDGLDNDLDGVKDNGLPNNDGDDFGDACDPDDDNDGASDVDEIAAGSDPFNPASTPEVCDGVDNDLDGEVDEGSLDTDGDGQADCVDPDIDGDGRPNGSDPFPFMPNRAPSVDSPGAQTSTIGVTIASLSIVAVDLDGDGLMWSATGLPEGLLLDQTGQVTGTPTPAAAGSHTVTIAVSDGLLGDSASFTWFVNNTPAGDDVTIDTPQVDITFATVTQPGSTQVTPQAPPPPDQVPTGFSVAGLPAFDVTTTAQFTGPITLCFDASSLSRDEAQFALLRVLHGEGGAFVDRTVLPNNFVAQTVCASVTSLSPFALAAVVPVNGVPSVNPVGQQTSQEDVAIAPLGITGSDPDGDSLTFTATGLPPGLTGTPGSNNLTITGTPTQAGNFTVVVTVSDGTDSASASFLWVVTAAPVQIALTNPGPQTNTEGDKVRLVLKWDAGKSGKKKHSNRPTFRAEHLPRGLHIDRHDGVIFGHISRRGEGVYPVTVTMRVKGEEVSQTFQWTIRPKNHAPRIKHLDDQESRVGQFVKLKLAAFDQDDDDLTFSAVNLPPGLTMDPAGLISGTPTGQGHYRTVVTVSDGHAIDKCDVEWTVKAPKEDKPTKDKDPKPKK